MCMRARMKDREGYKNRPTYYVLLLYFTNV